MKFLQVLWLWLSVRPKEMMCLQKTPPPFLCSLLGLNCRGGEEMPRCQQKNTVIGLFWYVCTDRLVWRFLLTFVAIFIWLCQESSALAARISVHCDLWEAGNRGRRSHRCGNSGRASNGLLGLGCLAGVAVHCSHTVSSEISLSVCVLGRVFPLLCVLWISLVWKRWGRVPDFEGEAGREELSKSTVLYKFP